MEKIKNSLIKWLQSYFERNGVDCNAVIGISGGKDSSVVAALCVEALGKDRVIGVLMPNGYQSDMDVATDLVHHLDIVDNSIVLGIQHIFNQYELIFEGVMQLNDMARKNILSRIRTNLLYMIAECKNGRVINTSNASENYIGWCTRYGDMAGDCKPLINLTCTEVIELGGELGLPERFLTKPPEDGLSGKTDEAQFGFSYNTLDNIISEYFSGREICSDKNNQKTIEKIKTMHLNSNFKRRSPPEFDPRKADQHIDRIN